MPLVLLLFPLLLNAQIVLTDQDGPVAGDSVATYFIADSLLETASVGDSAPGQTWNFNLPKWESGFSGTAYAFANPTGTLFDTAYPTATLVRIEDDGFPDGGVSATWTYSRTTPDRIDDIGAATLYRARAGERDYIFIKKIKGLGRPLPMTYGTTWDYDAEVRFLQTPIDTSLGSLPRLSLAAVTRSTGRVDAWGTVVTPHGAWPALRVHALDLTVDTIFTELGEPEGIVYDTLETYDWYIRDLAGVMPVVSMEIYQGEIASIRIAVPTINHPMVGVDDRANPERFHDDVLALSPNPAAGIVVVRFPSVASPAVLRLYSLLGEELTRQDIPIEASRCGETSIDLSTLPEGTYIVELCAGATRWSGRILHP